MPNMRIKSVNVGLPQRIVRGDAFRYSSIGRQPVEAGEGTSGREILLTHTGLKGDQPTETQPHKDGQMHGGFEKAVYVYPDAHYDAWTADGLGPELPYPAFGENLTVEGVTEEDVCIGDVWAWGSALLRVTKPRQPCVTLNFWLGINAIKAMTANGRCGWYMAVHQIDKHWGQLVPLDGSLRLITRLSGAPTVAAEFARKMQRV
jgi:MOSC domain-containing protein YiiM